jgi:hypothetical protein
MALRYRIAPIIEKREKEGVITRKANFSEALHLVGERGLPKHEWIAKAMEGERLGTYVLRSTDMWRGPTWAREWVVYPRKEYTLGDYNHAKLVDSETKTRLHWDAVKDHNREIAGQIWNLPASDGRILCFEPVWDDKSASFYEIRNARLIDGTKIERHDDIGVRPLAIELGVYGNAIISAVKPDTVCNVSYGIDMIDAVLQIVAKMKANDTPTMLLEGMLHQMGDALGLEINEQFGTILGRIIESNQPGTKVGKAIIIPGE